MVLGNKEMCVALNALITELQKTPITLTVVDDTYVNLKSNVDKLVYIIKQFGMNQNITNYITKHISFVSDEVLFSLVERIDNHTEFDIDLVETCELNPVKAMDLFIRNYLFEDKLKVTVPNNFTLEDTLNLLLLLHYLPVKFNDKKTFNEIFPYDTVEDFKTHFTTINVLYKEIELDALYKYMINLKALQLIDTDYLTNKLDYIDVVLTQKQYVIKHLTLIEKYALVIGSLILSSSEEIIKFTNTNFNVNLENKVRKLNEI